MDNFDYRLAATTAEAQQLFSAGKGARYVAGGTNLIDLLKYNLADADMLVDINQTQPAVIKELADGGVRISALMTNAETAYHPLIEQRYPLLSKAILAGASAQIRNMATNGGNLLQRTRCYYFYDAASPCNKRNPGSGCPAITGQNRMMAILGTSEHCIAVFPSDMCVALAALEAVILISGPDGQRTVKFEDFHRLPGDHPEIDNILRPGELITAIDLPPAGFSKNYAYLKLRDRSSYAFALVSVATGFELENGIIKNARIALGGVAHKPWRVKEAEKQLIGKLVNKETLGTAADKILQGAMGFEHNTFKIELAKRAIIRNGLTALKPELQLPGAQPADISML
ncbi:xanthine dehydrogenase family protein subunit M [Mucilaginibacter sp. UR6-1]|uniref:FAD binding domain-containing protein n=1 Tax=Mucilaginibacter sp. UR6-1 TaxID=1435643 RepID=UPI001E3FD155|nr:xanthine dehydrogenase family protein subunit M [Mucilaginibacter sp. UR6-1]MCC8410786.1 xanthine dehydrogenase family protein subunit M [Mucilaginibacter sp. UR6-1]